MADEEKSVQEKLATPGRAGAASNAQPTATETTFKEYKQGMFLTDVPNKHTAMKSGFILDRSKRAARREKRCYLLKSNETVAFYQALSDLITVFAKQEAEEINANVADYKAKNADLATKVGEALKAINLAKEKILIAGDKTYKMEEALKNSALSDAVAEMDKVYGAKGEFRKAIEAQRSKAEECLDFADDTVEVTVKVAGIQAGANLAVLEPLGVQLKDQTAAIHQNVATNATDARAIQTQAQGDYDQALKELVINKYIKYDGSLGYGATLDTISQAHQLDCVGWGTKKYRLELERIARTVEGNFIENFSD